MNDQLSERTSRSGQDHKGSDERSYGLYLREDMVEQTKTCWLAQHGYPCLEAGLYFTTRLLIDTHRLRRQLPKGGA